LVVITRPRHKFDSADGTEGLEVIQVFLVENNGSLLFYKTSVKLKLEHGLWAGDKTHLASKR